MREHLGAAASGGKVYVVGGRVGGVGNNLAAAEAFDPASGRWSAVADLPTAGHGALLSPPPPGLTGLVGDMLGYLIAPAEYVPLRSGFGAGTKYVFLAPSDYDVSFVDVVMRQHKNRPVDFRSGHRLGTAEVESALVDHPKVAEAA